MALRHADNMSAAEPSQRPGVGRLVAMPFIIINMGAEMMYILEQRLQAQSIAAEKSQKGERCGRALLVPLRTAICTQS